MGVWTPRGEEDDEPGERAALRAWSTSTAPRRRRRRDHLRARRVERRPTARCWPSAWSPSACRTLGGHHARDRGRPTRPGWSGSWTRSTRSCPPRPTTEDEDDEQVVYDLSEWDDESCVALLDALTADTIPYGLDGDELFVGAVDEKRVDEIVAALTTPGATLTVGGPASFEAMSELFVAADELSATTPTTRAPPGRSSTGPAPPPAPARRSAPIPGGGTAWWRAPARWPTWSRRRTPTPSTSWSSPPPSAPSCARTSRPRPRPVASAGDPGRAGGVPLAADRADPAGGARADRTCRSPRRPASAGCCSAASSPATSRSSTPSSSTTSTGSPSSSRRACACPQPRLRHRFQQDRIGLTRSVHRLVGQGEDLTFEFEEKGAAAQHILAAVYAAGQLPLTARPRVMDTIRKGMRWVGPARPRVHHPPVRPRSGPRLVHRRVPRSGAVGARRARPGRRTAARGAARASTCSGSSATCCATPTPTTAATPTTPPSGSPTSPRRGASCSPREPAAAASRRGPAVPRRRELVEQPEPRRHRGGAGAAAGAAPRLPVPARGPQGARPAAEAARLRGGGGRPRSPTRRAWRRTGSCSAAARWADASARWPSPTGCPPPAWC